MFGSTRWQTCRDFSPPNSGSQFFNYKRTFSIVFMVLEDANSYGKNSDSGIYANSYFGKALEMDKFNVPKERNLPRTQCPTPNAIVGDKAFPLKTHLLTRP